nr:MAG TPA: hypothetical protein [Caudoviricetes sp.]
MSHKLAQRWTGKVTRQPLPDLAPAGFWQKKKACSKMSRPSFKITVF